MFLNKKRNAGSIAFSVFNPSSLIKSSPFGGGGGSLQQIDLKKLLPILAPILHYGGEGIEQGFVIYLLAFCGYFKRGLGYGRISYFGSKPGNVLMRKCHT